MAADGIDGYPSREDRIVAEFGDGFDVEGIALRYGLTVADVYAVVEREVGPASQGVPSTPNHPPPGYYAPPPPVAGPQGHYVPPPPEQGYYGPPAYQVQPSAPQRYAPADAGAPPGNAAQEQGFQPSPGYLDDDAIVAEYGDGHDVEWIARKHGINVERVYEVVQRIVKNDPQPPAGPTPSW